MKTKTKKTSPKVPANKLEIHWSKIKNWKTVCKVNGIPETLPKLLEIQKELRTRMIADYQLMQITKAINGKWKCNYKDPNQYKYFPYFWVDSSGFGFSGTFYVGWNAGTYVGSHLCFETREQALHSGKYFKKIHINHQLK